MRTEDQPHHQPTSHLPVRETRFLGVIAALSLGASGVIILIHLAIASLPAPVCLTFAALGSSSAIALVLLALGKSRKAGAVYILSTWFILAYVAYFLHGDLNSPLLGAHLLLVVGAGLLISPSYGYLLGAANTLFLSLLYIAEVNGRLPMPVYPVAPLHYVVIHLANLLVSVLLVHYLIRTLSESDQLNRTQAHELRRKNRELEKVRATLKQEVKTRTTEILQQKRYYEALVENNPLAIVTLDEKHRIVSINHAFERLFGYADEEVIGKDLDSLVSPPDEWDQAHCYTQRVLQGETVNGHGRRLRKDGQLVEVELYGVPVLVDGKQIGVLGLYQDISERRRTEQALLASEEQLRSFFENATTGMAIADLKGRFTRVNRALGAMIGYAQEELLQLSYPEITHPADLAEDLAATRRLLAGEIEHFNLEKRYLHKNGSPVWVSISVSLIRDQSGEPLYCIGQVQDISERKHVEEQLHYLATRDMLTDLPNRYLFVDHLDLAISRARREQHDVAVLFLDLDGFKQVNDTLGHQKGDVVLQQVAQRLRSCPRESDTVARLGGDEFGMILENISGSAGARKVADKILASFILPFEIAGRSFPITTSIGISLFPTHSNSPEQLIRHADTAMYTAKSQGGNRYEFCSQPTSIDAKARKSVWNG